jgi:bacteriochlorophyllide a dehydrogenase
METLKSRAVVFPRPLVVEVAEVDLPEPGDGDVLVEVAFSALSPGTERWCLQGLLAATDGSPIAFPHVPGYQAAGVVRAVGSAVSGLRPGDRVFSRNCRAPRGWPATWWGGHVGLHVADPRDVLRLPAEVSLRAGASLLLAQVGYNGASRPHIEPGDVAAVIGDGLVGQYAAQVLRGRGARVLLAGLVGERLALARRHSADEVFDAGQGDFAAFVRSRAPEGAAVAVEAAGTAATVAQAVGLLRRDGELVMNGYYPGAEGLVDWHLLRARELTLHCPNSRTRPRLEASLGLLARGVLKAEELVTHELPVADAARAYRLLLDADRRSLGVLLRWSM